MGTGVKLIFACDVSELSLGLTVIEKVYPHIDVVKIGLEAMTAEDNHRGETLARSFRIRAQERSKDVMEDWKLLDVKNTMLGATRNIVKRGSRFFTIHATASDEALEAVAEAAKGRSIALAVTVLTDLDDPQCQSRFSCSSASAVEQFARNAYVCGIRGFVCSAQEARIIRQRLGGDVTIVTPAIRPLWAVKPDEQKRITTPAQAVQAGADAVVVGRPISQPPPLHTEASAAQAIREELNAA